MEKYTEDSLMFKVLQTLECGALGATDLLDRWSTPGLGYKGRKIPDQYRELFRRRRARHKEFNKQEQEQQTYRRLHRLLYYLEKQGLVTKEKNEECRYSIFSLTERGREKKEEFTVKIERLADRWREKVSGTYIATPVSVITVVVFDIPEKEKRKRNWLRGVLYDMSFRKIQKSVWAARVKLPSAFIKDLKKIDILRYVLICSVVSEGTISERLGG